MAGGGSDAGGMGGAGGGHGDGARPGAPLRIPLEPMGYQPMLPEFLLAGSSMLTVDFVDKNHLLITFGRAAPDEARGGPAARRR